MMCGVSERWTALRRVAVMLCLPALAGAATGAAGAAPRAIQVQAAQSVGSWPSKPKRWALVIGVDKYADTQITTLGGSSNDAKSIADALVKYAGFPQDQVILLASDQPAERQPTRGNILRRLSNLTQVIPADGLLFLSFAGHGMDRGNQAFLLPSDAQLSNDIDLLEQTAINVTMIKQSIRKTGVQQVVLVLDACRNDPGGRADQDNPLTPAYVRGFNFDVRNREVSAFATLYATAVGERAYEYTEKHQGYFTWELVEGLRGAAANARGEVTLSGLLNYVQQRVPKHVLADLGSGKEQKPFAEIGGYQADDLVIAIAPRGAGAPAATTVIAPAVAPAAASGAASLPRVDPAAVELMFWETIKNSTDAEDFRAYLAKYPNGQFADLARRRSQSRPAAAASSGAATVPVIAQSVPRSTAPTIAATRSLWSSQVYMLGYYLGYAEVAAYQNATALQLQQFLESAREVSGQIGYAAQPLDQMLNAARGGAGGQAQYQSLLGVRQTLEQQLNINANCGRLLNLRGLLLLGYQQGFMEVVAYQGGDQNYLSQVAVTATQYAAFASLPTAGLQEVSRQLATGTASRDQYQPLVNLRQQTVQALTLACSL
jgi:hypothetical protein